MNIFGVIIGVMSDDLKTLIPNLAWLFARRHSLLFGFNVKVL